MSRRRPVNLPCGTRASYMRGCRCTDCQEASRAYHRAQRLAGDPEPKLPVGPTAPGPWIHQAACRGSNPEAFFPAPGANVAHLRTICADCPVRPECLAWALDAHTSRNDHGFYGGSTPRERRELRRAT